MPIFHGSIEHQYDYKGNHRLVYTYDKYVVKGEWMHYEGIATVEVNEFQFQGYTDYFCERVTFSTIPAEQQGVKTLSVCRDCETPFDWDRATGEIVEGCEHERKRSADIKAMLDCQFGQKS